MRQLKVTKSITNRSSESLNKYLQDISKEEMVTPEEEVALAKRIRKGDQVALDRMVRANLRFVVSVAKKYQNQGRITDLLRAGTLCDEIGLPKLDPKFDRVMMCGSPSMLKETCEILDQQGFHIARNAEFGLDEIPF